MVGTWRKLTSWQGILLVYDITAEKSFENIKTWIRNIEQHASDDVEKMILGNKCDMEDKRVVTKDQGAKVSNSLFFVHHSTDIQSTCSSHQSLA